MGEAKKARGTDIVWRLASTKAPTTRAALFWALSMAPGVVDCEFSYRGQLPGGVLPHISATSHTCWKL